MKNAKRILCTLLAILMMVSFGTSFSFAASATLDDYGIVLDDTTVTAESVGTDAFTVKLPDGRPRIPQVSASGA